MVFLTVRIPRTVDRAMEIEAAHRDWTKQQLVEIALRRFLRLAEDAA